MIDVMLKFRFQPSSLPVLAENSWIQICRAACLEINKGVVFGNDALEYPPSLAQTDPNDLLEAFSKFGFVLLGRWQDGMNLNRDTERAILIHWPTMSHIVHLLPYSTSRYNNWAFLFWGMASIIQKRSQLYHNLLLRRFAHSYEDQWRTGEDDALVDWSGVPALSDYELSILSKLEGNIRNDKIVWSSFSRVFRKTMQVASSPTASMRADIKTYIPKDIQHEFSVFRLLKHRHITTFLPSHPATHILKGEEFSAAHLGADLSELSFLKHFPRDEQEQTGVRLDTQVQPSKYIRVVHMGAYATFRTLMGTEYYYKLLKELDYGVNVEEATLSDFASDFVQHFHDRYPELQLPPQEMARYTEFLKRYWPGEPDYTKFLFVSMPLINRRMVMASRMERNLKVRKLPSKGPYRTKPPQEVYIRSPKIPENSNTRYDIYMIRRYNKSYFKVPWTLPQANCCKLGSTVESPIPLPGVYIHPESGSWYYTLSRLMTDSDSPLALYDSLHGWLKAHSHLTKPRFARLKAKVMKERVNPNLRLAECSRKLGLSGIPFKLEEDAIITMFYRPGMSKENTQVILRVCLGRTWAAISNRASGIRERLIAEGETDINKLPHKNYNANLRRRLARNELEKA